LAESNAAGEQARDIRRDCRQLYIPHASSADHKNGDHERYEYLNDEVIVGEMLRGGKQFGVSLTAL
jgi:hypothetical protein